MCLKYILVGFTPSIILSVPPSPLRTISAGFILLHIQIQNTSTILILIPLFGAHPLPLVTPPRKDLFFPPVLHFFKEKLSIH
jgi:hypothetical protein